MAIKLIAIIIAAVVAVTAISFHLSEKKMILTGFAREKDMVYLTIGGKTICTKEISCKNKQQNNCIIYDEIIYHTFRANNNLQIRVVSKGQNVIDTAVLIMQNIKVPVVSLSDPNENSQRNLFLIDNENPMFFRD